MSDSPLVPTGIPRVYNNVVILQRADGYWSATAMCKANRRLWADYYDNKSTREFLEELSSVMGIPITELVQSRQGGNPILQGTWVHRRVAIDLARWCDPRFAVQVNAWVDELLLNGRVELTPVRPPQPQIGEWAARITPTFEEHKRYVGMNCPDGAWSVLIATVTDVFSAEDVLIRHCLPTEHHNLPDGSIGKMYATYRHNKGWARPTYSAPLVLCAWRKEDGADVTVPVTVYDADERRYFDGWLKREYMPQHLPQYLERKFSPQQYGLATASAADNCVRRITGQRAALSSYVLKQIDDAGGCIAANNRQLGAPPRQGELFGEV